MGNVAYEELTAGEDLVDKDVVYISGNNTVKKVTGTTDTIIGVVAETIANTASGQVVLLGRKTVACTGVVTAGDLLVGAATGKVTKFTPTTTKGGTSHLHSISEDVIDSSQTERNTDTFLLTIGEFSGGKILGKAATGGTNTDIDMFVGLVG